MLAILSRLSIVYLWQNKKYFYTRLSFGTWLSNLHV